MRQVSCLIASRMGLGFHLVDCLHNSLLNEPPATGPATPRSSKKVRSASVPSLVSYLCAVNRCGNCPRQGRQLSVGMFVAGPVHCRAQTHSTIPKLVCMNSHPWYPRWPLLSALEQSQPPCGSEDGRAQSHPPRLSRHSVEQLLQEAGRHSMP